MTKIKAPKMVYILGEEMTRYGMKVILDKWIKPHVDISNWEFFDLSCKSRDETNDQVLADLVESGARIKSIFKEPTITPTAKQKREMGLKNTLGSPNGAIRKGWNGITISRDTIHLEGMELGFKNKVYFDRQAIGGEYGASFANSGKGTLKTIHIDEAGKETELFTRPLSHENEVVVTYNNPLDSVPDMARYFFQRALDAKVTPYIVTKKTVFKWQEEFWKIFRDIFNEEFKEQFNALNLLEYSDGELAHQISDAACMSLVKWKDGGFAMASHNYDGDMLTDLISQLHRSPGFIQSTLIGKAKDGTLIKEFEASHGTVSDMERRRLKGEETSLNPIGLVVGLCGAMRYSAELYGDDGIVEFADKLENAMLKVQATSSATRDIVGKSGSTTEAFVDLVAKAL